MPPMLVLISDFFRELPVLHPDFEATKSLRAGIKYLLLKEGDPRLLSKIGEAFKRSLSVLVTGHRPKEAPKGFEWRPFTSYKLGEVARPLPDCWILKNFGAFQSWTFDFRNPKTSFDDWQLPLDPRCRAGGQDIKDKNDRLPWRSRNWINYRDLLELPKWLLNDPVRVYLERSDATDFLFLPEEKDLEPLERLDYFPCKEGESPDLLDRNGKGWKLKKTVRKSRYKKFLTGPEILERAPYNFSWMGSLAGWPLRYCPPKFLWWWATRGEFTGPSSTKQYWFWILESTPPEKKDEVIEALWREYSPKISKTKLRERVNFETRVVSVSEGKYHYVRVDYPEVSYHLKEGGRYFPDKAVRNEEKYCTSLIPFPLLKKSFMTVENDHMKQPTGELGEALKRFVSTPEFQERIYWKEQVDISTQQDPSLADTYRDVRSFRGVWTGSSVAIDIYTPPAINNPYWQRLLEWPKSLRDWYLFQFHGTGSLYMYLQELASRPPQEILMEQKIKELGIYEQWRQGDVYAEEYSEYGWKREFIRGLFPKPFKPHPPAEEYCFKDFTIVQNFTTLFPEPDPPREKKRRIKPRNRPIDYGFDFSLNLPGFWWKRKMVWSKPLTSEPALPIPPSLDYSPLQAPETKYEAGYWSACYDGRDVWGKWGTFMGSPVFLEVENVNTGNLRTRSLRDKIINSLYQGDDDSPTFETGLDEWAGRKIIRNTYPVLSPQNEMIDWTPPPPPVSETVQEVNRHGVVITVQKNIPPEDCTDAQYRMGLRGAEIRLLHMYRRLESNLDRWRKMWQSKLNLDYMHPQEVRDFYDARDDALNTLLVEEQDLEYNLYQWVEASRNLRDERLKGTEKVLGPSHDRPGEGLMGLYKRTRKLLEITKKVVLRSYKEGEKVKDPPVTLEDIPPETIRDFLVREMTKGWFVTDTEGNTSLSEWMVDIIEGRRKPHFEVPESKSDEEIIESYLRGQDEDDEIDLDEEEEPEDVDDEEEGIS